MKTSFYLRVDYDNTCYGAEDIVGDKDIAHQILETVVNNFRYEDSGYEVPVMCAEVEVITAEDKHHVTVTGSITEAYKEEAVWCEEWDTGVSQEYRYSFTEEV